MVTILKVAYCKVQAKFHELRLAFVCKVQGIKRVAGELIVAGTGLGFVAQAHAVGPDLSTVTAAVDFGTVTAAVLLVAAALIVVYIAWKGAKMVISAVRGG